MSALEAEILTRVICPGDPTLARQAAEAILTLGFGPADKRRMEVLAEKARAGTLNPEEQAEVDGYERVGHFVSLLKSKARRSLATV